MHTASGFLSRKEYIEMASKLSPLPPEMRTYAYDAFEEYLKRKRKHNLYDICDIVFHLYWQKKSSLEDRTRDLPAPLSSRPLWNFLLLQGHHYGPCYTGGMLSSPRLSLMRFAPHGTQRTLALSSCSTATHV